MSRISSYFSSCLHPGYLDDVPWCKLLAMNTTTTQTPANATQNDASAVFETDIKALEKLYSGKVRDLYAVDDKHLLIVATDRISAFDVILPKPIAGKGRLLTDIALFWFDRLNGIVPDHRSSLALTDILTSPDDYAQAEGRSMIVRRLNALPIEAVVRGYLIGSGWRDYQETGAVSGIELPKGLQMADQLPELIFTPAAKAQAGDHDENIDYATMVDTVGADIAEQIKTVSLTLYREAAAHARERGIIIADTKFEFGLDDNGTLTLMDEIFTPDSSRFWDADSWQPGTSPASYDKQFIRDYLDTLDWDKTAPGPELPQAVIDGTLSRYRQALTTLQR